MCDYVNPLKCLICRSGYYQQFDGQCTKIVIQTDNTQNPTEDNTKKY